jgi:hypothetical protein
VVPQAELHILLLELSWIPGIQGNGNDQIYHIHAWGCWTRTRELTSILQVPAQVIILGSGKVLYLAGVVQHLILSCTTPLQYSDPLLIGINALIISCNGFLSKCSILHFHMALILFCTTPRPRLLDDTNTLLIFAFAFINFLFQRSRIHPRGFSITPRTPMSITPLPLSEYSLPASLKSFSDHIPCYNPDKFE